MWENQTGRQSLFLHDGVEISRFRLWNIFCQEIFIMTLSHIFNHRLLNLAPGASLSVSKTSSTISKHLPEMITVTADLISSSRAFCIKFINSILLQAHWSNKGRETEF